jgi:putative tricarboxylic transport membrane protein
MLADRVILVCTIVIAVVYMYATTQIPTLAIGDPLGPKAFPRLLGVALLIAAGFLALELWRARKEPQQDNSERPAPPLQLNVIAVLAVVCVWTGVYYLLFERLGYIAATSLYLLPLAAWFNRGKWIANVLSTILFVGLTYALFVELDVRLPQGILPF